MFLLISLLFLGIRSFVLYVRRLSRMKTPGTCIILYYHSIPYECREAFARQLEILSEIGQPLNPAFPPNLTPGGRYAAVTFDDAFEDAVENAVPELVQRKIPAIFFVTTGFLGQAATWWPPDRSERNSRIASTEQLRRLPPDLIEVGAHSVTHPRLSELDESDARREIVECRRSLKAILGREVNTFSFPYGDFNEQLVRLCREAGYQRVFTSESKGAFGSSAEFVVGRVAAEPTDWTIEFRVKLLGGYLWRPWASAMKRKLLRVDRNGRLRHSFEVPAGN
jgi:peptidoglycan/xylan/chitin deacetylase (PgdA/CDA1 family)